MKIFPVCQVLCSFGFSPFRRRPLVLSAQKGEKRKTLRGILILSLKVNNCGTIQIVKTLCWNCLYCIPPQFLTLMLLSFVRFVVFLNVLFESQISPKTPGTRKNQSFASFARVAKAYTRSLQTCRKQLIICYSGWRQLASRTNSIVWHKRSDNSPPISS